MATEVELFNAAVVSALPHGMIVAHAGKTVPDGFLLCNGAAVSRKTYAKLFEAIGVLWGAGDGSTTFNLPDSDGRVLQGATDVSKVGKYLEAGLPNITGVVGYFRFLTTDSPVTSGAFGRYTAAGDINVAAKSSAYASISNRIAFYASQSSTVYSPDSSIHTVQPPAAQVLMIIKA